MYYEHNMQIIKDYRKFLYERLMSNIAPAFDNKIEISSILTRTKEYALEIEKDNIQYRLNSKYNPKQEAKKWAEQYQLKNLDTVIAMLGLGNGIFIRELIEKMDQDNRLIVYEPSLTIFKHVLQWYDIEDILKDSRVYIIIKGINDCEFPYLLSRTLSWLNLFSQIKCIHPGYEQLFKDDCQLFEQILQDNMFNNIVAKNTYAKMGKNVVDNTINNITYLENSISVWDLYDVLPKDVPAIIVAAGPSLNKNVEVLKEAKGKSIIFVVDRAYETLLDHNVEPDFVVTMDAIKPLKYCGNKKGFSAPLLCKLEGSPEIFENHNGKKIIYNCEDYNCSIFTKLEKKFNNIEVGGSVTTAAFSVCAKMGFKRIILIGLDLAYAGELTHAGSFNETVNNDSTLIKLFVDDINGNKISTRHDWYTFLRWFENVILQIPEYDIIDATEGGARIKGTRIMTLQEVVTEYCNIEVDCRSIIDNIQPTFNTNDIKNIYEYLKISRDDLVEIKNISRTTIKKCIKLKQTTNLLQRNVTSEKRRLLKNITSANQKIEEMPVFSLINQYILSTESDDVEKLYFMTNNEKTDESIAYESTEKIYNSMIEACDFIIPKIDMVIDYYLSINEIQN